MADIYAGSLTFDGEVNLPDPSLFGDEAPAPYFATYVTVRQGDPTGNNWFQIVWGGRWDPMGGGPPAYSSFTQYRYGTDYLGEISGRSNVRGAGVLLAENEAAGDGCAFCVAGGPLSIEQDPDADQVRFSTSLGSHVESLSGLGLLNDHGLRERTEHQEYRYFWDGPILDPPLVWFRSRLTAFNGRSSEVVQYAWHTVPPGSPPLLGYAHMEWNQDLIWRTWPRPSPAPLTARGGLWALSVDREERNGS